MGDAKEYPLPMPIPMPHRPSSPERKKSAIPARFFLDLAESFLFLVWMPSFFMVRGRSTCPVGVDREMSLIPARAGWTLARIYMPNQLLMIKTKSISQC